MGTFSPKPEMAIAMAVLGLWPALTAPSLAAPIQPWRQDHSRAALIQGNRPTGAWRRANKRCIEYPTHTVIETNTAELSTTIAVYPAALKCRESGQKGTIAAIFQIQGEAESFSGLIGDVLVTDTGTGTDGRILTLYSITNNSKIREIFDYSDPVELTDQTRLAFWLPSRRATKQNCRDYTKWLSMGLGAVIEVKTYVDTRSNKLYKSDSYRCSTRQVPIR